MITVLYAGDARRSALDAVQTQIAELLASRDATAGADVTRDELAERCQRAARSIVDAGSVRTRLRYLAKPGNASPLLKRTDGQEEVAALFALLLGESTIAARLLELSLEDPLHSPGFPASERAAKVAELDAALRELHIAEELEARKLEAGGGIFVMRRRLAEKDTDAILAAWDRLDELSPARQPPAATARREPATVDGSAPDWMQGARSEAP